jgi:hypothetical protein
VRAWRATVSKFYCEYVPSLEDKIICVSCYIELKAKTVTSHILAEVFPLSCPKCGFTYMPEELAVGKMIRVEKLLEDK